MTPPTTANPNPDADSTRDRIVAAATAEFSRYGIAGARIERIAKAAKTSKERVYAHFRSKEALYRFVAEQELAAVTEATRLDPGDLPEYAGRLHDYFMAHPDRLRLMTWGRLELADMHAAADADGSGTDARPGAGAATTADPTLAVMRYKVGQISAAQDAGLLDPAWDPIDILVFVNQISTAWAGQMDLVHAGGDQVRDPTVTARRAAVVAAVARLFPAAGARSESAG